MMKPFELLKANKISSIICQGKTGCWPGIVRDILGQLAPDIVYQI